MEWIAGKSPAAQALEKRLDQVAASDVGVLIQGESGAGKSAVAREIHGRSLRAAAPLAETQLSMLSPTLLEAELFGHAAGAFTGAQRAREGRFQRAGEGTLVLEGIETLTEELQLKLLRVLQERVIEPLGSEESHPLRARVLATSSRDLREEVRAGRFRADLYFRLAVVVLEVPSLRERAQDIALLAERLLAGAAARLGVPARRLTPQASARLEEHRWPGNLRELENALERVLALGAAHGGEIAAEELDFLREARADALAPLVRSFLAQGVELAPFEAALLEAALRESHGNVSAAARALGMTRKAFEHRHAKLPGKESA